VTPLAFVLLKLLVIALPLLALAWGLRVYPCARLVRAAILPALATLIILFSESMLWLVVGLDAALALLLLADLLTLPRRKSLSVERHAGRIASLGKNHPASLLVMNHSKRGAVVEVRDGVPHEMNPKPHEFSLRLAPRSRSTLNYVMHPGRRGAFALENVHVKAVSRLGFWQRYLNYPAVATVCVYPDMKQLSQYALLARTNRLSLLGVRRARKIGQDHDFERLRDYALDDNYKHIEWRATARRQKLTVKDFQVSQSQRIIFLMDCGRMMTNQAAGLSLLDHSLNAMLMLAYVALRQGDSVGMITFSDEVHGFVPPRGGMNQMNRLLHASFDRFPQLTESRYDHAFRYLASHCRKRSLVVLATNVIDEVNSQQIERYLTNLVGRHLPLGILLRDRQLFDALDPEKLEALDVLTRNASNPVEQKQMTEAEVAARVAGGHKHLPLPSQAFWRAAAAADILSWRHQVICDLQRKGVLALDVFPEDMTAPLVNRYLEIKARHLL
jgi:uncharacterized protein (DUF58 family)